MHPSFARCLFGCRFQSSLGNKSTCVSVVSGHCLPSLGQHCCPDKANPSPWRETRHVLPVSSLEVGVMPSIPNSASGDTWSSLRWENMQASILSVPITRRKDSAAKWVSSGCIPPFSLTDSFLLPFSYVSLEGVSVCWHYFKGRQKSAAD